MTLVAYHLRPYRPCVGMMVVNARNQILVAKRRDTVGEAWQMPQGGMDGDETPYEAALRELKEEIGSHSVSLIAESESWLSYDVPPGLAERIWGGAFRGQTQKWLAFRFLGNDDEINLERHLPAEFCAWRWSAVEELPHLAVSFKKEVYERVIEELWPRVLASQD